MIELPAAVQAMSRRGPHWATWTAALPGLLGDVMTQWRLRVDGPATHGYCSLVLPVRSESGAPAMVKISFPDDESEHEHLALRRWAGAGAVRLLSADPRRRALLLERLRHEDLTGVDDTVACQVVAGLYSRLHVAAVPQLRTLASYVEGWTAELATLPRSAPVPRRLVEQALSLAADLRAEPGPAAVIHSDLHYANVLAADREPWLVIDPKPINGDPHYELAPMLWNRWSEMAPDLRGGVRRRFHTLVEAADFDEDRARAWVVVRMVLNAMWALQDGPHADPAWLTTCIAVAKAVQP